MITRGSTCLVRTIALCDIHVEEYQPRYLERVLHYVKIMEAYPDDAPGFLCVKPSATHKGAYALLDGHTRFVAHIITGRSEALCVIIYDVGQMVYDAPPC